MKTIRIDPVDPFHRKPIWNVRQYGSTVRPYIGRRRISRTLRRYKYFLFFEKQHQ